MPLQVDLLRAVAVELGFSEVTVFEKLTKESRILLVKSQNESKLLRHSTIGTEHFILGLLHSAVGKTSNLLVECDITYTKVQETVEAMCGLGSHPVNKNRVFSNNAKRALTFALYDRKNENEISPHDILNGIILVESCTGYAVLKKLGMFG